MSEFANKLFEIAGSLEDLALSKDELEIDMINKANFHAESHQAAIEAMDRANKKIKELELDNRTLRSANSELRATRKVLQEEIETLKTSHPEFDRASKKKNEIIQEQTITITELRNQIRHYKELIGHIQKVADKFGVREEGVSPIVTEFNVTDE